LLLHFVAVISLILLTPEKETEQQQPTFVRLINPPVEPPKTQQQQQQREFEIDQSPAETQPQQPVEAVRKADRDQQVMKEQAPKGDDDRDRSTNTPLAQPEPQQKPVQPSKPKVETNEKTTPLTPPTKRQDKPLNPSQSIDEAELSQPVEPHRSPAPPLPQFSPEQLMPDRQILDRIIGAKPDSRSSIKQRDDVQIGDTIWLNLQHDLLVSFFRRFHDQVERVWNYPREALELGQEGTLELLITVDQQGELLDVDLRRSSGSDILDYEAIQAIYRGAPFGPLGRHYPHEKLNIRAYFHYSISGRYIYGQ
jgi:protein TonB